ncbi:hypothetical protein [Nonomuraea cavernae]|uniref:Uncharacterized protein n=1 Tax=Nonomuraea cavernae TaxID=2045107 RepID=A0A917Z0D3_9ACTN|nr:hypothetical protein [Nonomuraea cavernae]MCA2185841.1 hypothetical protein [Nonomuraea cavernae]GGO69446.1 hypothetical protein GCM10012289_30610 [Nonomuraea cavernae]
MTEQPLQVQGAGLRNSAINLDFFANALLDTHRMQRDGYPPVSAMPMGALGIIGEAARLRYNNGFRGFNDRLIDGVHSAKFLSRTLIRNLDGYTEAENANVQDLIRMQQRGSGSDLDFGLLGDDIVSIPGNPLFDAHRGLNRNWEGMTLTAGATVSGLTALGLRQFMAKSSRYVAPSPTVFNEYERARVALRSSRTAGLLKLAGQMSLAATVGALAWATAVVPSDEVLDDHVNYWASVALSLSKLFAGGDPAERSVLAQAWSGDAMVAADAKLRAFITAGIQLSDEAVARAYDLAQAVANLNLLHDLALGVTVMGVAALAGIRIFYSVNPVAALAAQETMGRKITIAIMAVQAVLTASMGMVLYAGMDGQRRESGPSNVPSQDFPRELV